MAEHVVQYFSTELTGHLSESEEEIPSESEGVLFIASKRRLRAEMPRLTGYAEIVVPLQSEREFRSHFRLSPDTALVVPRDGM